MRPNHTHLVWHHLMSVCVTHPRRRLPCARGPHVVHSAAGNFPSAALQLVCPNVLLAVLLQLLSCPWPCSTQHQVVARHPRHTAAPLRTPDTAPVLLRCRLWWRLHCHNGGFGEPASFLLHVTFGAPDSSFPDMLQPRCHVQHPACHKPLVPHTLATNQQQKLTDAGSADALPSCCAANALDKTTQL